MGGSTWLFFLEGVYEIVIFDGYLCIVISNLVAAYTISASLFTRPIQGPQSSNSAFLLAGPFPCARECSPVVFPPRLTWTPASWVAGKVMLTVRPIAIPCMNRVCSSDPSSFAAVADTWRKGPSADDRRSRNSRHPESATRPPRKYLAHDMARGRRGPTAQLGQVPRCGRPGSEMWPTHGTSGGSVLWTATRWTLGCA